MRTSPVNIMPPPLLALHYRNISNRAISAYPVTYGVPLAAGVLHKADFLALRLPSGAWHSVQAKPLEMYPDGSIKWLLLDFSLRLQPNEIGIAELVQSTDVPPLTDVVANESSPHRLEINTPKLRAAFDKEKFSLFASYAVNGRELIAPGSDIVVEDINGKRYYASLAAELQTRLIENGPERTVVQVTGRHTAEDDSTLLDFRLRYTFRPGEEGVAISYKFTNREESETGILLSSISIQFPTTIGPRTVKLLRQTSHGKSWFSRRVEVKENVELRAGQVQSAEAVTRYGTVAEGKILIRNLESLAENLADYPYYLRPGNARTDMTGGLRQMYPYIAANGPGGSLLGWFFEMEHHYPKSISCERGKLQFDIWPQWAGEFRLRRGQSKEHDFYLSLSDRERSHEEMEGVYFDHEILGLGITGAGDAPLEITLSPDYVRSCEVLQLHRCLPYDDEKYFTIEAKLGTLGVKGDYGSRGMMDFGDWVNTDRSSAHNNENDAILEMVREYYRRQEPTMLPASLAKARHNAHVDFIAYDPDPLRQGTMPAHCPEHTDGSTYPSHMWVEGLMAAYNITGNMDFLEAALSVGENMLRWQQNAPEIFYADSRECGWPMLAFLRLHEWSGESRWLDACHEVFEFYRRNMGPDGEIKYELPHGVGTVLQGYGEFISWRALFFYYERTGNREIHDFLVEMLDKVYKFRPGHIVMGWACNDLFPAWAAYQLTGNDKYIEDNYPFLQYLMQREGRFPWGGVDMQFYLGELHRRGSLTLAAFGIPLTSRP